MKPALSSLWTSTFVASIFSSIILRSFYFLGFMSRLTCSLCSITSLLTPMRSEVDHVKTSLFLSRKARSSTCSSGLASVLKQTAMSGTLGSSTTFLRSPSASMPFLNFVEASCLLGHSICRYCSISSLRKCTFLWPGVKPCSIFLASF
jgi:hypothetical protein